MFFRLAGSIWLLLEAQSKVFLPVIVPGPSQELTRA